MSKDSGNVENYHLGFHYVGFDEVCTLTKRVDHFCIALSEAQDFQDRHPTAAITKAYRHAADRGSWATPFYKSGYGPKIISRIGVGPGGDTTIWRAVPSNTAAEEYEIMLRVWKHSNAK